MRTVTGGIEKNGPKPLKFKIDDLNTIKDLAMLMALFLLIIFHYIASDLYLKIANGLYEPVEKPLSQQQKLKATEKAIRKPRRKTLKITIVIWPKKPVSFTALFLF
ncbi:hypothetical protein N7931_19275 [Catenovulum sp. 2E275]|uniref:hypothetical protein n=1 Tax=Catenovulum sp. 2E275 TaxID=2980497 RepID=UPI0021CF9FFD|nr:hypothetical protein [Catenovulum sp. 2E275]MCU4677754.1 hypothetical protein [Catenovulum sp. 2E275]